MARKTKRRVKKGKMILLISEVVVLVLAVVLLIMVIKKTSNREPQVLHSDIPIESIEVSEETKERFESNEELKEYKTYALFGVDSRNKDLSRSTRTDVIMIVAVNTNTGEAKIASVYRDTYLNIGNDTYNKCNAAYAKGGPEQAINMLNMNMDLYIQDYVTVGFEGVMKTIDAIGGVQIDVQKAEIGHLNNYQASMYATEDNPNKLDTNYIPITEPGLQTLNGRQALAYCRIRYTAGDDFRRTERQREVLQQILIKAKTMSPTEIDQITRDVFPNIATSLELSEILELLGGINKYTITETTGFPFSDHIATGKIGAKGSCVVPVSLQDNVVQLQNFLYPGVNYELSPDVINYSDKIRSDTSSYIGK